MAHTYAVGDSIAVGCGETDKVDRAFATGGMFIGDRIVHGVPIAGMAQHFAEVTAAAQSGDTVIVSAGYNGGINAKDRAHLVEWIGALTHKGVHVAILGLREEWKQDGGYSHLRGTTREMNSALRNIANDTGAVFDDKATMIANGLNRGEIHGDKKFYSAMVDSALDSLKANRQAVAPKSFDMHLIPARPTMPPQPAQPASPVQSIVPEGLSEADIKAVQRIVLREGMNLGAYGANKDGVDGNLGSLTAKAILALEKQHPDELIAALGKDKAQAIENEAHHVLEHAGHAHGLPRHPKATHHRE